MPKREIPNPQAGLPDLIDDGPLTTIKGRGYGLAFDRTTGELKPDNARHNSPLLHRPALHLTRFDFGDLRQAPPYAVLPDSATHHVENVRLEPRPEALLIEIRDRYALFTGTLRWLLDREGISELEYDYVYTGSDDLYAREIGLRLTLPKTCDTLKWKRWSEWGIFPEDHISRTEGTARAHRDSKWPPAPESTRPTWPWSLDETEGGTNDFRSAKFNIYEATLSDPAGRGIAVNANADAHVRACISGEKVLLHILSECRLGPVTLKNGDRLHGRFHLVLDGTRR